MKLLCWRESYIYPNFSYTDNTTYGSLPLPYWIIHHLYLRSVSPVPPSTFPFRTLTKSSPSLFLCKGMEATAYPKHRQLCFLPPYLFCSRLPQSQIGYSSKYVRGCMVLCRVTTSILSAHKKAKVMTVMPE